MKAVILVAILFLSAASAHSQQKLKDLLYGGKLKLDSGSVIRKDDDLSTKIDTTTRKPVVVEAPKSNYPVISTTVVDSAGNTTTITQQEAIGAASAAANTDNNKSWKDFMDEMIATLKTEVLPNKKVKDGTYSVLIEYVIDVDGQVSVNSVSASPESSFLEQQVKERITLTAPKLTPLLGTNGKPRKAVKKQTITLTK